MARTADNGNTPRRNAGDPVPLEKSIERLTCAIASSLDSVMVGWPACRSSPILLSSGTGSVDLWPIAASVASLGSRTISNVAEVVGVDDSHRHMAEPPSVPVAM